MLEDLQINRPDFIVYVLNKFAVNYDMFNQTWAKLCNEHIPSKPAPKQLLLISDINNFNDMVICDKLTEEGFCIRKTNEFQPCAGNCNNAIATKSLYDFLVSKGFDRDWNNCCDECNNLK